MKIRNTFIIFFGKWFWHGASGLLSLGVSSMRFIFLPLLLLNTNRSTWKPFLQWDLSSVRVFLNILSTFALTCLAWIFLELNQLEETFECIKRLFLGKFCFALFRKSKYN
jgi:D-alanyl-lipoteichoic acid acyltransferase DltB (MBOAT superfamily)